MGRRPVPDSRRFNRLKQCCVVAPAFLVSESKGNESANAEVAPCHQRFQYQKLLQSACFQRNMDFGGCHGLHCEQTLWTGLAPLGFEI